MNGKRLAKRCIVAIIFVAAFATMIIPHELHAYTPESDEVRAMIEKGVVFLEKSSREGGDSYSSMLGGTCLRGLAVYKHTTDADRLPVKLAVEACQQACQSRELSAKDNYSIGIALIFLSDLDPVIHRAQIDVLLSELLRRQKPHGGWGYEDRSTGDTSQVQYAALGAWMAVRQNIDIPLDAKERLANWLLRVQDVDGSYGYQGVDPGSYARVAQAEKRLSLQVAAMGSLYIATEMLGFVHIDESQSNSSGNKLLPALQKKEDRKRRGGPITDKVPPAQLKQALADGNRFFAANYKVDAGTSQYYYMYGLERYLSFRELAEGTSDKEPRWYNDGVNYLRANQKPDGSWQKDYYGPVVETSFAMLFLMRSTKKTIQKIIESGALIGGKELPDDLTDVRQTKDGKIISTKDPPVIDDVLSMLEDENSPLSDFINGMPELLQLATDPAKRAQQLDRIRRLAVSGTFQARLTAVNTLSRHRDLDNVPSLIFAVTDPDIRIARAAAKGLQFISRRLEATQIAEDATRPQKQEVAQRWKKWYLSVRPDGSFIE